jgi:hypothetical protein
MQRGALVIMAALAIAPLGASAHGPKVGQNGGPQEDAGSFHVEIVPQGTVLQVYLKDHSDKAVSTQGFKGTAIFVINGKAERIPLIPAGDNQLGHIFGRPSCPTKGCGADYHSERQHSAGVQLVRAFSAE